MIWLDVTKTAGARHKSGLTRVTAQLGEGLGAASKPASWRGAAGWEGMKAGPDWFVTAEVFSPAERAGFEEFLRRRPLKVAAIFHDAIPLELPDVTWPQAVARHPAYMSMLADFDRVFAVSQDSREKLEGYWKWQGRPVRAKVAVLALGADFESRSAVPALRSGVDAASTLNLLCVGIIEPRKRQDFLLSVAEKLWAEGVNFDLGFVGRVNPHFGAPLLRRIKASRAVYHGAVDDETLIGLYRRATACVLPTAAEGCGLPLLEALGQGTPCVASDIPALRENAGGGCVLVPAEDEAAWVETLRVLLTAPISREGLASQAQARRAELPRWADTARALQSFLSA